MEHHAPHHRAAFEGYYNKFVLPSGAQLVVVISKIRAQVQSYPNALSFTYIPQTDRDRPYQKEIFVNDLELRRTNATGHGFILDLPGIGYAQWHEDGSTEYHLQHSDFSLQAQTGPPTPWSKDTNTPEGSLVYLPLPLHWHVQSLDSACKFSMTIAGYDFPAEDSSGEARVHQEKNWANAFPSAHIWIQARDGDRGICAAGGEIVGTQAFLLGYRSKDLNFDFRPPFAVGLLGLSPFMSYTHDWESRTVVLQLQSFRRKIVIEASAPKGSFFSLSPPFKEGHLENYLGQSLRGTLKVRIYESGWFGPWKMIREEMFDNAGLEFGAGYYPPAGTEDKFN